MKKIYKFCIGALLGTITVSCVDQLDSDKNFKDRMTLEDVFTNEKYSEEWLAHAYSYLKGENMDVGTKDNILWCFADDIYFGDRDIYNTFKQGLIVKETDNHGEPVIKAFVRHPFSFKIST